MEHSRLGIPLAVRKSVIKTLDRILPRMFQRMRIHLIDHSRICMSHDAGDGDGIHPKRNKMRNTSMPAIIRGEDPNTFDTCQRFLEQGPKVRLIAGVQAFSENPK